VVLLVGGVFGIAVTLGRRPTRTELGPMAVRGGAGRRRRRGDDDAAVGHHSVAREALTVAEYAGLAAVLPLAAGAWRLRRAGAEPMTRALRVALAAAFLMAGAPTAPAGALTPPVVDPARLPTAASPAPPGPTTQLAPCATPVGGVAHGVDLARWRPIRAGQRIAVIDTGVNRDPRLTHLDAGGDYVSTGDGTQDCDGHGTAVAGIIADIAPAATLLAIRQSTVKFGASGDPAGSGYGDVDTMARAVRTAADAGATVINISAVACAAGRCTMRRWAPRWPTPWTSGTPWWSPPPATPAVVRAAGGERAGPRPPSRSARPGTTTTC
jgi:hypothetical protein